MTLGMGLVGADGTGKTTLLNALREHYSDRITWITEIARGVIGRGYPLGKAANQDSYIELIHDQFAAVLNASNSGAPFLSDRTVLDAYCYSVVNSGLPRPFVTSPFIHFLRTMWLVESQYYAFYFYLRPEFGIVPDGTRETDEQYQKAIDQQLISTLTGGNRRIYLLTGSVDARFSTAVRIIDEELCR
jgi:nicotinamide riboside kinase